MSNPAMRAATEALRDRCTGYGPGEAPHPEPILIGDAGLAARAVLRAVATNPDVREAGALGVHEADRAGHTWAECTMQEVYLRRADAALRVLGGDDALSS